VTSPTEGPATVTQAHTQRTLERLVEDAEARVGALTADLAAAERVIANVRALAEDLFGGRNVGSSGRHLISQAEADRLVALLPAAPTEEAK
jgi:hypothetical protein